MSDGCVCKGLKRIKKRIEWGKVGNRKQKYMSDTARLNMFESPWISAASRLLEYQFTARTFEITLKLRRNLELPFSEHLVWRMDRVCTPPSWCSLTSVVGHISSYIVISCGFLWLNCPRTLAFYVWLPFHKGQGKQGTWLLESGRSWAAAAILKYLRWFSTPNSDKKAGPRGPKGSES